jgi:hypothetical protein
MFPNFSPHKNGITVLIPNTDAAIAEIHKDVFGNNPQAAVEKLRNLIIPKYFKSLDILAEASSKDVVKTLGGKQLKITKSKNSDGYIIEGTSVKLTPEPKFVTFTEATNMAAYGASGFMERTGGITSSRHLSGKRGKGKRGGDDYDDDDTSYGAAQGGCGCAVDGAYQGGCDCLGGEDAFNDVTGGIFGGADLTPVMREKRKFIEYTEKQFKHGRVDIYADLVCSFLDYLRATGKDDQYWAAIALLDPHPIISFYIYMYLPGMMSTIITDDQIVEWIHSRVPTINPYKSYLVYTGEIDRIPGVAISSFEQRQKLRKLIKEARAGIFADGVKKDLTPASIKGQSEVWAQSNTVGDISNVFPALLSAEYAKNPNYKLIIDEFRYSAGFLLRDAVDMMAAADAIDEISLYLVGISAKQLSLFGDITSQMIGNELLHAACMFLCSTDYFYIPETSQNYTKIDGAEATQQDNPQDAIKLYSTFVWKYKLLESMASSTKVESAARIELLKMNYARLAAPPAAAAPAAAPVIVPAE